MTRQRVRVIAVLAVFGTAALQSTTFADRDADCSKLAKWNSDKTYKKDARVWSSRGGMNNGAEYACDQAECRGVKDQPYSTKAWRHVATCKNRPSGS